MGESPQVHRIPDLKICLYNITTNANNVEFPNLKNKFQAVLLLK